MSANSGPEMWHISEENAWNKKQEVIDHSKLKWDKLYEVFEERGLTRLDVGKTKPHYVIALCKDDLTKIESIPNAWDNQTDKSFEERHAEQSRKV